jgi:hypothetical protein
MAPPPCSLGRRRWEYLAKVLQKHSGGSCRARTEQVVADLAGVDSVKEKEEE